MSETSRSPFLLPRRGPRDLPPLRDRDDPEGEATWVPYEKSLRLENRLRAFGMSLNPSTQVPIPDTPLDSGPHRTVPVTGRGKKIPPVSPVSFSVLCTHTDSKPVVPYDTGSGLPTRHLGSTLGGGPGPDLGRQGTSDPDRRHRSVQGLMGVLSVWVQV